MSAFHIGQKVVLVNAVSSDGGESRKYYENHGVLYPQVGTVYTVRKVVFHSISGIELLLLTELDNEAASLRLGFRVEQGFEAFRFRPVVKRKTSIEIFKAMLNPSRVEEHA